MQDSSPFFPGSVENAHFVISIFARLLGERPLHSRDVLHIAIEIEAPVATFAANSGVSASAEGCGKIAHEEAIDPYRTGDHLARETHRARLALTEDHSGQSIGSAVRELDRFIFVAKGLPGENGSKHLALNDFLLLRYTFEQCRLKVKCAGLIAMPAPKRLHTSFQRAIDEALNAFIMFGRDERADASRLLARIANCHLRGCRSELALKLIGDFFVNQNPRSCEAHLARIKILTRRRLCRRVEISICANDERRLAAELEC